MRQLCFFRDPIPEIFAGDDARQGAAAEELQGRGGVGGRNLTEIALQRLDFLIRPRGLLQRAKQFREPFHGGPAGGGGESAVFSGGGSSSVSSPSKRVLSASA